MREAQSRDGLQESTGRKAPSCDTFDDKFEMS